MSKSRVNNVAIFNTIWESCSENFKTRLPQATTDNLKTIADKLFTDHTFQSEFNEFMQQLVNKIAFTLIRDNKIENRFSKYIYYNKPIGQIIEELAVQIPLAENYDPKLIENNTSIDPYRITKPDVDAVYISESTSRKYRTTIFMHQLRKAFNSEDGLIDIVNMIIASLTKAKNLDEFTIFHNVLNSVITNTKYPLKDTQKITFDTTITDKQSALTFVQYIKNTIADMLEPRSCYNNRGVIQQLNLEDIVIFLRKDIAVKIQTLLTASSFNPQDLGFTPPGYNGNVTVELIDNFGGEGAYRKAGSKYEELFKVYDKYGKFSHYSEEEDGEEYKGEVFTLNNYMLNEQKTLEKNVVCLVCDKRLPIISVEREKMTTTYNGEADYQNYVYLVDMSYSFSLFSNVVVMFEPYKPTNFDVMIPLEDDTAFIDTSNIPPNYNVSIQPSNPKIGEPVYIKIERDPNTPEDLLFETLLNLKVNSDYVTLNNSENEDEYENYANSKECTFVPRSRINNLSLDSRFNPNNNVVVVNGASVQGTAEFGKVITLYKEFELNQMLPTHFIINGERVNTTLAFNQNSKNYAYVSYKVTENVLNVGYEYDFINTSDKVYFNTTEGFTLEPTIDNLKIGMLCTLTVTGDTSNLEYLRINDEIVTIDSSKKAKFYIKETYNNIVFVNKIKVSVDGGGSGSTQVTDLDTYFADKFPSYVKVTVSPTTANIGDEVTLTFDYPKEKRAFNEYRSGVVYEYLDTVIINGKENKLRCTRPLNYFQTTCSFQLSKNFNDVSYTTCNIPFLSFSNNIIEQTKTKVINVLYIKNGVPNFLGFLGEAKNSRGDVSKFIFKDSSISNSEFFYFEDIKNSESAFIKASVEYEGKLSIYYYRKTLNEIVVYDNFFTYSGQVRTNNLPNGNSIYGSFVSYGLKNSFYKLSLVPCLHIPTTTTGGKPEITTQNKFTTYLDGENGYKFQVCNKSFAGNCTTYVFIGD